MLIDTHCHLNDERAFPDPEVEIEAAHAAGVERMILVGTHPDEWARTLELAQSHRQFLCALGWHPNYTVDYNPQRLVELRRLLADPKVVALGEIGLDYHWDYAPRDTQHRALSDQLDLAAELGMPVVFHAREAYGDLLDDLESRPRLPYLFHFFAGTREEAERAKELDAYFGIDGPITYKNADELRRVISGLPRERLVLETDAPYLAPAPFRGKPNRPAYVSYVNDALASMLGLSPQECADLTTENARRFFGAGLG